MSRTTQVTKNILSGFLGQIITALLSFATRTVFIYTLSAAYLGINSLFASILTVLNLSELGIGVSITYALYKPIADNDKETIKSLMHFYKIAYRIIGCVILLVGLSLVPFLDYIISGDTELVDIRIVFCLYILESVISYWLFAYKRTLLEANQEKYIVTLYNTLTTVIISLFRIIVLLTFCDTPMYAFYTYTAVGIIGQICNNIFISRVTNKKFAYLQSEKAKKLSEEQKKPIFRNIAGVLISKLSGIMLTSVDNILISAFINISTVGIYSNYVALRSFVIKPIGIVFDSMTASIGDFCAQESIERQEQFFYTIQFAYFWIYGFSSICLWILINPFIAGIWINEDYLLSNETVMLIVINFLLDGLAGAVIKFRDAHGLYWQAKYRYLFSACFNGIASIMLIKPLGINGVLIGTTLSILIMVSIDPVIVYKNVFKKSSLPYYRSYLKYFVLIILTGALVTVILMPLKEFTLINFGIKLFVCIMTPNLVWYLLFRKNMHFIYLQSYGYTLKTNAKKIVRRKT